MRRFIMVLIISTVYLVLGNVVGVIQEEYPCSGFIEAVFAPYTFIAGMSSFAGWDTLSYVLEAVVFMVTLPLSFMLLLAVNAIRAYVAQRLRRKTG